jgi:hypothetical protein
VELLFDGIVQLSSRLPRRASSLADGRRIHFHCDLLLGHFLLPSRLRYFVMSQNGSVLSVAHEVRFTRRLL